jgi:uncharacterized protein
MKISEERGEGAYLISGYGPGYLKINHIEYRGSVLLSAKGIEAGWPRNTVESLTADDLDRIVRDNPELVLIGTGAHLQFPARSVMNFFLGKGIGVEIMDTHAACRTYNLLVLEGRNVTAALINPESST